MDDLTVRADRATPAPAASPHAREDGPHHRYATSTDASVRYLPVFREGVLLGCLWAAEADDAAGFVAAGTDDGVLAERFWADRVARCEGEGLRPLQALRRWVGEPEDPVGGAVPAEARERTAVSLGVLRGLSRPG